MTIQSVASRRSSYIDFLLPGVLSLAIMQSGIFGVAFGFFSLRKRGVLRRLSVTPVETPRFHCGPGGHAADCPPWLRLLSWWVSGFSSSTCSSWGNLLDLFVVGLLGGARFPGHRLLAGRHRQDRGPGRAPLANVVSLPMMLLSGVFFSRSNLPELVRAGHRVLSTHLSGRRHAEYRAGRFNSLALLAPTGRASVSGACSQCGWR